MRIGHGFDVHAFGGDKPLLLGGVEVPGAPGLLAHSDGDVVLHAITDALLGAMALGDIGEHFPDDAQEFAGIDSRQLLRRALALIAERAHKVANLDVTIVAQTPRLAQFKEQMRAVIAADLQVPLSAVNLKATTTEKLGYIGREQGIACHAVLLLCSL